MTVTEGPATVADVQNNINSIASSGPKRVEYKERAERKRLTKADIVNGTKQTRDHYVKQWEGYVTIRPLSEGEWQEVQQHFMRGVRHIQRVHSRQQQKQRNQGQDNEQENQDPEPDIEVDVHEQQRGAAEADRLIVAYGLSIDDETWTVDEVAALRPPLIVEELAREILKLSGIKTPQSRQTATDENGADGDEEEVSFQEEVDAFHSDT